MGTLGRLLFLCYAKSNFAMVNTEYTFLDKHLTQKVLGGLDETCRFCDEFSIFFLFAKTIFLSFNYILICHCVLELETS